MRILVTGGTGFVGSNIVKNLIKMNYSYDTSFFRSIYLYPMIAKIYLSNINGDFSHASDICNGIYLLIKKKMEL